MEGDRLLTAISKGEKLDKVLIEVQSYLGPLINESTTIDVKKYQHFALRALKLTIQELSNCKTEEKKLPILHISETLVLSISSRAIVNEKITSFSFEKLLINLVSQAPQTLVLDLVKKCYAIMKDRLDSPIRACNGEARSLMKTMADVIWKTALQLEQSQKHKPEQVLDMRKLSVEGLLASGAQLQVLADRIVKSDLQFSKIASHTSSTYTQLAQFHESLLENTSFLACLKVGDCNGMNVATEWLMMAHRSCLKQEKASINQTVFHNASEAIISHACSCVSPSHPLLNLSLALIRTLDHFIVSPTFPSSQLSQCTSLLIDDAVDASLTTLTVITETIEAIVSHISLSVRSAKRSSKQSCLSHSSFQGLKVLVFNFVKFIDLQLKLVSKAKLTSNGNMLECSSKSRQLSLLNVLMTVLLDLLIANISQEDILEECLPLATKLEEILDSCAKISVMEHKWFGYNAYNLGLVLFQEGKALRLAAALLKMACEHLCHWCHSVSQDDPAALAEVNLVNKYSLLINCYYKSKDPDTALNTIKSMLTAVPVSLLQSKDSIHLIVSDFVKTKRLLRREDPDNNQMLSVADVMPQGSYSDQALYLEEELIIYEGIKEDVILWELYVATQLLTIYEKLPSSKLNFACLLIKQALLYNQLQDEKDHQVLAHPPLDMISEAIRILESAQTSQCGPEKQCLTLDLLSWGYLSKAICLHTRLISSRSSGDSLGILDDGPVVRCLSDAVDTWSKLHETIKSHDISLDAHSACFHHFPRTCDHLRFCVSLCRTLSLVPLAISSLNTLLALCRWNKEDPHAKALVPLLLTCKVHLLLTSYGEGYVDKELVSALEGYAEREGTVGDAQQLECQLTLALLRCKRGEFSSCNDLLRSVLSSPFLTSLKNTPDAHHLMSLLASVSSHYIQSQSQYIPLMDVMACLNDLTRSPSPICINCIKGNKQACSCAMSSHGQRVGMTELELALDSLNLTKGLSHLCSAWHRKDHTQQSNSNGQKLDDTQNDLPNGSSNDPTSLLFSLPSLELWNTVYELLSGLLRVSELFFGREAVKEAIHYATEGLEIAEQLCLKYWQVKFLLLLSAIKDSSDSTAEGDELREKVGMLLEFSQNDTKPPEDETSELARRMDSLSLSPGCDGTATPTLFHTSSCQCVCCVNPTRIILVLQYLYQLIRRSGCTKGSSLLQQEANWVLDTRWIRASKSLVPDGNEPQGKQRSRGRRKKVQGKPNNGQSMDVKESELVLPFKLRKIMAQIETLSMEGDIPTAVQHGEQALSNMEPTVLPYLHVPEVRVELAKLHFTLGRVRLQNADDKITKVIYERPCPTNLSPEPLSTRTNSISSNSLTGGRVKKARSARSRRRIIDSDEEQEGSQDAHSNLHINHTPLLLPERLLPFVSHFLFSYQLLSPTSLSVHLCRRLYHHLGLCLSIWHTDLAAHFIVCSSYLSFSLDAVLWTSKRKRHHHKKNNDYHLIELIFRDIQTTLLPSPPMDWSDPSLIQTSAVLWHLTRPLPLSYTSELINHLPPDWVFCDLSLLERVGRKGEKVMVLVRVSKGCECIFVKIPVDFDAKPSYIDDLITDDPLEQFQFIMDESLQSTKLTEKRKWWGTRRKLDLQMKELLEAIQAKWFHKWKFLLISSDLSSTTHLLSTVKSILSNCGIVSPDGWARALVGGGQALSRDDLQAIVGSLTVKYDISLIDKLYELLQAFSPGRSCPLILSLGHPLHQLPIENLSMLQDYPVSRIPSLPFLTAHLALQTNRGFTHINPRLTYYIVNPSGDLKNTEKVFAKWFEKEDGWEGVVGKPPTSEQFVYGFERRRVLIYCGHGRAREYLGGSHIQELDCQATLLQMGCSSGKLKSPGGDVEPTGMVFHFLLAGCPSLVVNLWDVTDVDIDRFCSTVVKEWLSGEKETDHYKLLQVLPRARNSCKLRYLVGASPVVYGLPVIETMTK